MTNSWRLLVNGPNPGNVMRVGWEATVRVEGDVFHSVGVFEEMPYDEWRANEKAIYERIERRLFEVVGMEAGACSPWPW